MGSVRDLALRIPRSAVCLVVTLLLLFLLTAATSCGGGSSLDLSVQPAAEPAGGFENLPPPSALRQASYDPAQLVCYGCDYLAAPGFPQQNASAVDLCCELEPSWTPADPDLAGLAYACYGFDMEDYDRPGKITFTWAEQGDPADLWIGLSDFTRDCWSWHALSGGNTLEVTLQDFVDPATKRMLVLPLATGTATWSLNLIQVGDLASVSGMVYDDEYAAPLDDVEVVLDGVQDFSVRTGLDGKWRIDGVPPGDYEVSAHLIRWAFTPAVRQLTVDGPSHVVEDFVGTSLPIHFATGSVRDTGGGEMIGVELQVSLQGSPYGSITTWSDTGGIWTCDLPDGDYAVTPNKPGWTFTPESRQFSIDGADVFVEPFIGEKAAAYLLDGYALSSIGAAPLADVHISAVNTDLSLYFDTWTGMDGYWSVPDAPDGSYTIEAWLYPWKFDPQIQYVTVSGSGCRVPPFIGTERGYFTVSGYAFLEDGVTPLPQVELELSGEWGWYYTVTEADGRYEYTDVMEGDYNLLPTKFGYEFNPTEQTITVDSNLTVDPFLATKLPAFQMDGYVYLPDGFSGIEGVLVIANEIAHSAELQATTDAAGYWRILDAPAGEYTVYAEKAGYTIVPYYQIVTVEDSDVTAEDFTGTPLPTYRVSGYVYELDGSTPVPGVAMTLDSWDFTFETTTNASGYWELDAVYEASYTLAPMLAPWVFSPEYRLVEVSGGNVAVDPFLGEELEAWLVDGYIYEADSTTPVPDIDILFDGAPTSYRCTTDASGHYAIPLPAGSWMAWPESANWLFEPWMQWFSVNNAPLTLDPFYATPLT